MAMPTQVELAGKRADEIAAAMVEAEKAEKAERAANAKPDEDQGAEPKPDQPQEAKKAEEQPETVKGLKDKNEALQHKLEVLQGKYNSEVKAIKDDVGLLGRLKNELREQRDYNKKLVNAQSELSNTVSELRKQIEKDAGDKKSTQGPAVSDKPGDYSTILTQDELDHLEAEDLGGKTLEVFMKLARAAAGNGQSNELEDRLKKITTTVEDVDRRVSKVTANEIDRKIAAEIPDFFEINANPDFIEWLKLPVSDISSQTRAEALQALVDSQNFSALKRGIDKFKADAGLTKQPAKSPDKPAPKRKQEFVEPDQEFAGTSESLSPGRVWTIAEISKFYTDQTKGVYRGREKEAAALDRDILLAQQQGRIK